MQLLLHAQELGGLLLGQPVDRDARPVGQHLGDDFLVDHVEELDALGAPLLLLGRFALEELLFLLAQALGLLEVLASRRRASLSFLALAISSSMAL